MKRCLCILFAVLVLFGLVGCTASKEETQTTEVSTVSTQNQTEEESNTAVLPSSVSATEEETEEKTEGIDTNTKPASQKETTDKGAAEVQPTKAPVVTTPKQPEPTKAPVNIVEKEWRLFVKGKYVAGADKMPVYDGFEEPALPLLSIAKAFGAELEWVSDNEVVITYKSEEWVINTEDPYFGLFPPAGLENTVRDYVVQEEIYVDISSAASIIGRWLGSSISVDDEDLVVRIQ